MFNSKKLILFITKSKIKLIKVTVSKIPKEESVAELEWAPSTIDSVLSNIKKLIKGKAKIILSEDFVYETLITLPKQSQVTHDAVLQKTKEFIPEDINKTIWSFKQIPNQTKIQITAIVTSLYKQIEKSIVKAGIQIDDMEPLSYALSRFTKGFSRPFLFVYIEDKVYLVLAQQQVVLATERLESPNTNAINQFVAFAKDNLDVDIKNVIFCGMTQNINLSQYQNQNFKTEIQDISPAVSLALKESLQKTPDTLSQQLINTIHHERQNVDQAQQTNIPRKHSSYFLTMAIGCFIAASGIMAALIVYNNTNSKKTGGSQTNSSTIISPTVKPPTPKLNKLDYTIIVLNGSGKAGQATTTKNLLENNGFNVVKIGNADNHNYQKTQVRLKETVPNNLILLLDKTLKSVYDFSIGTKLEENSESDILIIIGKK